MRLFPVTRRRLQDRWFKHYVSREFHDQMRGVMESTTEAVARQRDRAQREVFETRDRLREKTRLADERMDDIDLLREEANLLATVADALNDLHTVRDRQWQIRLRKMGEQASMANTRADFRSAGPDEAMAPAMIRAVEDGEGIDMEKLEEELRTGRPTVMHDSDL